MTLTEEKRQNRALALGRLGTAAKHAGNAEDRINDAIFYALYLGVAGFTLQAEEIIHRLAAVQRDIGRLEALLR